MKKSKRYIVHMLLGFLAYGLSLVLLNLWFDAHSSYWLVILTVLPLIYISTSIIRFVTTMDEMQRKIIIDAMAFAGITTGFSCFSYLFLRDMGAPEFQAEWAFYVMWIFFGIGSFWSFRRYQ